MGKAICYIFIGILLAAFFQFLRVETKTATHGKPHWDSDSRSSLLRSI